MLSCVVDKHFTSSKYYLLVSEKVPYLIYYNPVSNTMHQSQIYHFKVFLCQHITS